MYFCICLCTYMYALCIMYVWILRIFIYVYVFKTKYYLKKILLFFASWKQNLFLPTANAVERWIYFCWKKYKSSFFYNLQYVKIFYSAEIRFTVEIRWLYWYVNPPRSSVFRKTSSRRTLENDTTVTRVRNEGFVTQLRGFINSVIYFLQRKFTICTVECFTVHAWIIQQQQILLNTN